MKTSMIHGTFYFPSGRHLSFRSGGYALLFILCFQFSAVRSQTREKCCVPSFPSLTIYQTIQTGHGIGFGVEAGNWQKERNFSYFFGSSIVWSQMNKNQDVKMVSPQSQTYISFYMKGQYQLTRHLYVVAAPGITNLTYFELQTGLRYVVPLTKVIGVGVEPAYAFNLKQFLVNLNMHFALR